MERLEVCPSTKSGRPVGGMDTPDVLIEFDASKSWDFTKLVLATALAELFGGYITQVDGKGADGFFFCSKNDEVRYIYFSDINYRKLFAGHEEELSIAFSDKKSDDGKSHSITCIMVDNATNKAYVGKFTDLKQSTAELISFVKCCIQYKRDQEHDGRFSQQNKTAHQNIA